MRFSEEVSFIQGAPAAVAAGVRCAEGADEVPQAAVAGDAREDGDSPAASGSEDEDARTDCTDVRSIAGDTASEAGDGDEVDATRKARRNAALERRQAEQAKDDRNAAVAELKRVKAGIQEMECTRAATHAVKSYSLEDLGAGTANAGGAKGKRNRVEVLERLSHLKAGLSAGQKNDWKWFQYAWDDAMVKEHKDQWASLFSRWVQNVLGDERRNAFSLFVFNETKRVLGKSAALQVPGL